MRVVLDTNILISALLIQTGYPAAIYTAWQEAYFTLLTCAEQLTSYGPPWRSQPWQLASSLTRPDAL